MKIIVIGGGIMGLACAWRLAVRGAEVTLFEARCCGEGATLASLGALWPPPPQMDEPIQWLHRASLGEFESFARDLSRFAGMPVRYRRGGRIELLESAHAADRARAAAGACGSGGFALEYLDAATVAGAYPNLVGAPSGALRCPSTAQVDVPQLVAALCAACRRAGVDIREGTTAPVESAADATLIAAGAWSGRCASVSIRPVKGQGIALRPPAGMPVSPMFLKRGPIYLIPWPERDEIFVGSTTEPDAGFDETPSPAARETLLAGAFAILPALRDAPILRHWAGLRPQNPAKRHPPLMGPVPSRPNVWLCAGHFKTGIGMAPLVSRLMAESILTGQLSTPLAPFAP